MKRVTKCSSLLLSRGCLPLATFGRLSLQLSLLLGPLDVFVRGTHARSINCDWFDYLFLRLILLDLAKYVRFPFSQQLCRHLVQGVLHELPISTNAFLAQFDHLLLLSFRCHLDGLLLAELDLLFVGLYCRLDLLELCIDLRFLFLNLLLLGFFYLFFRLLFFAFSFSLATLLVLGLLLLFLFALAFLLLSLQTGLLFLLPLLLFFLLSQTLCFRFLFLLRHLLALASCCLLRLFQFSTT